MNDMRSMTADRLLERARQTLEGDTHDHPPADSAAAQRSAEELVAAHENLSSFAKYNLARPMRPRSTREARYMRSGSLRAVRQQTAAIEEALEVVADFQYSGNASALFRRGEAVLGGDVVRLSTIWTALQSDERLRTLTSSVGLSTSVSDSIDELIGSFDREVRIDAEGIHIRTTGEQGEQLLVDDDSKIAGDLLMGLARAASHGAFGETLPAGITWTRPGAPVRDGQNASTDVISLVEALQHAIRKESLNEMKVQQAGERPVAEGQFIGIVLVAVIVVIIGIGIFASYKCAKDEDSDWCTVGLLAFLVAMALGTGFDVDLDKRDPGMPETDVETQPSF